MVHANVTAVLQALGVEEAENAKQDAAVLSELERILAPVKDLTWPSGRPDNPQ